MIKLHYRPPEMRDDRDDKIKAMPFVQGGPPLCSDHLEAAETCGCSGIPVEARTIILRSIKSREPTG